MTSECTGIGPGGDNGLGHANGCVFVTGQGDECAPGCGGDADCASFPGTYCASVKTADPSPLSVAVCVPMPEAGPD
jgi:hypothetical protein